MVAVEDRIGQSSNGALRMTEPRTSTEVIEALRPIDSATVANAIEHFDVRDPVDGYASWTLLCQFPKLAPTVGYAITCTADTTTAGDTRPMRLHELLDMIKAEQAQREAEKQSSFFKRTYQPSESNYRLGNSVTIVSWWPYHVAA